MKARPTQQRPRGRPVRPMDPKGRRRSLAESVLVYSGSPLVASHVTAPLDPHSLLLVQTKRPQRPRASHALRTTQRARRARRLGVSSFFEAPSAFDNIHALIGGSNEVYRRCLSERSAADSPPWFEATFSDPSEAHTSCQPEIPRLYWRLAGVVAGLRTHNSAKISESRGLGAQTPGGTVDRKTRSSLE
jgi:hypothetical protein